MCRQMPCKNITPCGSSCRMEFLQLWLTVQRVEGSGTFQNVLYFSRSTLMIKCPYCGKLCTRITRMSFQIWLFWLNWLWFYQFILLTVSGALAIKTSSKASQETESETQPWIACCQLKGSLLRNLTLLSPSLYGKHRRTEEYSTRFRIVNTM